MILLSRNLYMYVCVRARVSVCMYTCMQFSKAVRAVKLAGVEKVRKTYLSLVVCLSFLV
jgi:hypothetical protein